MLLSEFIDRTGYQPTADEYTAIEKEYYYFKGDKDAYCRAWSKANPTKAGQIWKAIKEAEHFEKLRSKVEAFLAKRVKRFKCIWENCYDAQYNMEHYLDADAIVTICNNDRDEAGKVMLSICNTYCYSQIYKYWANKVADAILTV